MEGSTLYLALRDKAKRKRREEQDCRYAYRYLEAIKKEFKEREKGRHAHGGVGRQDDTKKKTIKIERAVRAPPMERAIRWQSLHYRSQKHRKERGEGLIYRGRVCPVLGDWRKSSRTGDW